MATNPEPTMLKIREVMARVGLARPTLYRMMQAGTFPKPIKVTSHAARWPVAEVDAWLASRPRGIAA